MSSILGNLPTSPLVDDKGMVTRAWQQFFATQYATQSQTASGSPVAGTPATNAAPYGYTTAAQADRIVALLNTIQSALIANGTIT